MESANLVRFDQQVAGHDKLMLMSTSDLIVVKPCKKRELDFYQDVLNFPDFQDFIPECYGTVRAATEKELKLLDKSELEGDVKLDTSQSSADHNLCLENVLHGFTKPCILDLKMGSLLYDADATEEKRKRMIQHSLNTTSSTLGLRISGAKVYNTIEKRYAAYDKRLGKSRTTKDSTVGALLCYLFPSSTYAEKAQEYATFTISTAEDNLNTQKSGKIPTKYSKWVIECFIDTIKEIRQAIMEHPNLRLIGSSLLFIYEGDRAAADKTWKHMLEEDSHIPSAENNEGELEEEEELAPKMCDIRMIDFAHSDWHAVRVEQDPDLIKGFDNIIEVLEECLKIQLQEKL